MTDFSQPPNSIRPRSPDPGDPRGDATREALVAAAIELFGHSGYHATSNRTVADLAGVNAALIGYHFGGKRGLYLAAFEHIAEQMGHRLGPLAGAITRELEGQDVEKGEARSFLPLLHRLLDGFTAMMTAPESAPWARLIVREQQDPTEALDVLWRGILGRILTLATRLVARLEGQGADDPRIRVETLTLMGQALVFRVARATALRHLGWDDVGSEEVALIQQRIRDNATAILTPSSTHPASETES